MRVLIFHGYLLSGTGSNVYNASLAKAMRKLGHEVHLVCQDRDAAELDFVDAVGDWDEGVLRIREGSDPSGGSVTVYTPDTGGLLPVFVRDRYAGFEVKTYSELTDAEIEDYIARNVQAVRDVVERIGEPDAALANHLVTAPLILDRAGVTFAVKVHGSDLSYTVLPEIERFGPMARDGARAAAGILVGSQHIADRLREAVDEPEVNAKVALGPPGVDTELFEAIPRDDGPERLRDLAESLEETAASEGKAANNAPQASLGEEEGGGGSSWDRDPLEAARAVRWLADTQGPRVVFVGKLIVSKGIDLLVAAWPLVHSRNPEARLIIAGFGAYRDGLEELIEALGEGDIERALGIAQRGRALEGGPVKPLEYLAAFLADPPPNYSQNARAAAGSIALAGRLEHSEVGLLVPACDALVFPSTHPEAFGMVAAEAASAGVLPVSAAHSGALEVSRALAGGLPDEAAGLVSFKLSEGAIESIASRLNIWLDLEPALKLEARRSLRETAKRLWGWDGVAREVTEASQGRAS